jgi:Fe2+ transport system protein FeoA
LILSFVVVLAMSHQVHHHSPPPVPLSTLRDGARGRLQTANLCCADCELLNAMGLTDQCEIRVCQAGEPCIVQVNSTRLGLAAALARNILVSVSVT